MSERKLATIQQIAKLEPIEGADSIERATIKGWQCVVRKGVFQVGDGCVYFEVDSLLPASPEYEFLRKSSYNIRLNGHRIRTIKLRGQISQGLVLQFSEIPILAARPKTDVWDVGVDVTELLGVRKYEPEIHPSLMGDVKGAFPGFIPKTDEERIQNAPGVLTRYPDKLFVITEKVDGTSSTFYVNEGEFGVCGRNWELKDTEKNTYWEVARKLNIENRLRNFGKNIAIQGEICGPGIQKNKYALSEFKLFVYHVFDINSYRYFDHEELMKFCKNMSFDMVPEVEVNFNLAEKLPTVEAAVSFSNAKSLLNPLSMREGIVIKSMVESTDPELGRLSFKVINPYFLLKHEE
jgi:RNA ligase (TIGR02306 family)